MEIFSKRLLINSKKPIVEILGKTPPYFSPGFNYNLIKRNDYFYMTYDTDNPKYGESIENVQNLNFIAKTKNFDSWEGSGIGSSFVNYDETADAFFCSHLGIQSSTKAVKYNIIKVNPDDFSYKINEILSSTMSETSRAISRVQRVGNYLMLLCYIGKTSLYSFSSTDNGNSWTSNLLSNIPSLGYGGEGISSCSNGKGQRASVFFNSSTASSKFFTSPTASQNSNSITDRAYPTGYTKGNKLINCDYYSKNILYISDDGLNDTQYSFLQNMATDNGVIYNDYFITAAPTNKGSSTKYIFWGKIILHNLKTSEIFLFDPELNAVKENYGSYYSQIKILNIFDEYLYFTYSQNGSTYFVARVKITDILDNLTEYTA